MNVTELIEKMQTFPPDAEVLLYQKESESSYADVEPIFDVSLDTSFINGPFVVIS